MYQPANWVTDLTNIHTPTLLVQLKKKSSTMCVRHIYKQIKSTIKSSSVF